MTTCVYRLPHYYIWCANDNFFASCHFYYLINGMISGKNVFDMNVRHEFLYNFNWSFSQLKKNSAVHYHTFT
jgi:hypothetical protein